MAYSIHKSDVLVIGSGGAGLRTAIEAHDRGANVLVLGKCKRGDAHTVLATGGINAALATMDPRDSWLVHSADTLREGRFIADVRDVETLCKNAPRAIQELVDYGVRFHRERDGRLTQRFFGAHTYRRTCFVGDRTGKAIEEALVRQVQKRRIPFLGEVYITNLLMNGRAVNGAFGFDMNTGELLAFHAKAVVLATGGYSRLYNRSSSRILENTGDGVALAYAVGAQLADMEMLQFHPTGMIWPRSTEGVLVTEAVRGEGGVLLNANNERFMQKYHPRGELGPRDVVARAIYSEIAEGRGTKHNGVWLDITNRQLSYITERLPKIYEQFKRVGVDISRERMEVAPTAHYSMGGVRVHRETQMTNIKGLFAVGEVTSGVHGANRLGGNSLLETIVFGRLCGEHVARYVKELELASLDETNITKYEKELQNLLDSKGKYKPQKLRAELQELMWDNAGIIRNSKQLHAGMEKMNALKVKFRKVKIPGTSMAENANLVSALDLRGLFVPAEALLRSAIARTESRGAHYRLDYPREKNTLYNIVCYKSGEDMKLGRHRATKPRGNLARAIVQNERAEHKMLE
ncbi:MAG: FAD-binding protein [Candidatus Aenigmarchaeota archaeon]|nr:FAD-binding protein [Candidatus Aenigmarchaeota archaeon]